MKTRRGQDDPRAHCPQIVEGCDQQPAVQLSRYTAPSAND